MNFRDQVLDSLKWLAAARFGGQIIAWAVTVVVIRLLAPSDYGVMAIANVMIGFAHLFREMGLYTAMVQKSDLTDRHVERSFGMLIVVNSLIYALLFLGAPLLAGFFGDPQLADIIRVLGLQFPLASIGVVQDAMLSRRMDFKRKSFATLAATLSNSLVTLVSALSGFGVWALVYGSLTGAIVTSIGLIVAAQHWCRPRFSREDMGGLIKFGGFVTTTRVLWYGYQQSDMLIIGKILGQQTLGYYAVATQLATLPLQKFAAIMNQVALAAYSKVQNDLSAVQYYYCKGVRMVSFFSFPVFWGISSIAPELVNSVLGDTWQPAIVPLQVLAFIMPLRMISNAGSAALEAVGKPHIGTGNVLLSFLVMPPAFLIGVQWGLLGVSLAWLFVFPLLVFIRLRRSLPPLGVTIKQYFSSLAGPAFGGMAMYLMVIVVREVLTRPYLSPIAGLLTLVITGALAYTVFMGLVQRRECLEVWDLVASKRRSVPA